MKLFHGSPVPDLTELKPFPSNHGKPYVYLTDCETLELLYARNPIRRPGGFFPYWFDKEGRLHYDEYFPDQLRQMYQGWSGYVYEVEAEGLPTLEKMAWVHLSDHPVRVTGCHFVPELHEALLDAAADGRIVLHRYEDIPQVERERNLRVVRRSLEKHGEDDYRAFVRRYMPQAE